MKNSMNRQSFPLAKSQDAVKMMKSKKIFL